MSSPWPTFILTLTYIIGVKYIGPRIMRDKEAFQLKKAILIYNFVQILVSAYLFREVRSELHDFEYLWNFSAFSVLLLLHSRNFEFFHFCILGILNFSTFAIY